MITTESESVKAFPELKEISLNLLDIAENIKQASIDVQTSDLFAFMALCFMSKQIDHLKSIVTLTENKLGRDTSLIARSMIEGLTQLLWAKKNPKERALRWHSFSCVEDWRIMNIKLKQGEKVDNSKQLEIENNLRNYEELFLKKNKNKKTNDPYVENWMGQNYSNIMVNVGADMIRIKFYRPFSAWHHWSSLGLASAISVTDKTIAYSSNSFRISVASMAIGIQCLFETIEIVNEHLALNINSAISDFKKRFIEWCEHN